MSYRFSVRGGGAACIIVHDVTFDSDETPLHVLEGQLSAEERARARRYRGAGDRRAFTQRRAALRRILASHLHVPSGDISFVYGVSGRPFLENDEVSFSLSHSRRRALVVLSSDVDVGCDLEWVDPDFDWRAAAAEVLSDPEQASLGRGAGLPGLQKLGPHSAGEGARNLWIDRAYVAAVSWRPRLRSTSTRGAARA